MNIEQKVLTGWGRIEVEPYWNVNTSGKELDEYDKELK